MQEYPSIQPAPWNLNELNRLRGVARNWAAGTVGHIAVTMGLMSFGIQEHVSWVGGIGLVAGVPLIGEFIMTGCSIVDYYDYRKRSPGRNTPAVPLWKLMAPIDTLSSLPDQAFPDQGEPAIVDLSNATNPEKA